MKNFFQHYGKRIIIVFLLVGGALLFLSALQGPEKPGQKTIRVKEIPDPEVRGENYSIETTNIPQTFEERRLAPAAALLPTHAGYPEASPATVDTATKAELFALARRWLRQWETFAPGEVQDGKYERKLRPMALPSALPALVARSDASDPPGVGADGTFRTGSRWIDAPGFARSAFVIDISSSEAYLVLYGAVRYSGQQLTESGSAEKAYGMLLRESGNKWLVERVASEPLR